MRNVEIVNLGDFDPERDQRYFDAVSFGSNYWRGLLRFVHPNVYVYSDGEDPE